MCDFILYGTHLLHHLFSLTQVGHSQSLPPVPCPVGPAQIPRPLQAFCSLFPAQRGKVMTVEVKTTKRKKAKTQLNAHYLTKARHDISAT